MTTLCNIARGVALFMTAPAIVMTVVALDVWFGWFGPRSRR